MPESLRLAFTTFTVLPLRPPDRLDRRTAGGAMAAAPLAGLLLGLLAAGPVFLVRWRHGGDLLAAAVGVGLLALLSRGLHLDGLADLADGLGAARDQAGTRQVMKSPEAGPLGVATVVLVLLLQVTALAGCLELHHGTADLLLAVATGRLAVTAACRRTPAATPTGLGAFVAESVRRGTTAAWVIGLLVVFVPWGMADPDAVGTVGARALAPVVAVGVGLGVARALRAHAVRRVGGLTGDVLGALVEVTTAVVLLVLALAG